MTKFLRIIVIIAACCVGSVLGAFLWAAVSGQFLVTWPGSLFLWSGISAVIGGYVGYKITRSKDK